MSVKKLRDNSKSCPQSVPFTQICNNVINNIKDADSFLVWCYLFSKSSNWKVIQSHIKNKFGFGNTKIKQIFSYLHRSNLVHYTRVHNEKGKIAHWNISVLNGSDFDINQQYRVTPVDHKINKSCAKTTGSVFNPVANGKLLNKEIIQKKDFKSFCATDVARDRFEEFWSIFPAKKNKRRAQDIWKRKRYNEIAELICKDVEMRKAQDHQWQDPQYIPHPSTYLAGERWNDEITAKTPSKTKQSSGTAFSEFMNSSKTSHGVIYDESGHEFNPFN